MDIKEIVYGWGYGVLAWAAASSSVTLLKRSSLQVKYQPVGGCYVLPVTFEWIKLFVWVVQMYYS
jgi:hypothetical protein